MTTSDSGANKTPSFFEKLRKNKWVVGIIRTWLVWLVLTILAIPVYLVVQSILYSWTWIQYDFSNKITLFIIGQGLIYLLIQRAVLPIVGLVWKKTSGLYIGPEGAWGDLNSKFNRIFDKTKLSKDSSNDTVSVPPPDA